MNENFIHKLNFWIYVILFLFLFPTICLLTVVPISSPSRSLNPTSVEIIFTVLHLATHKIVTSMYGDGFSSCAIHRTSTRGQAQYDTFTMKPKYRTGELNFQTWPNLKRLIKFLCQLGFSSWIAQDAIIQRHCHPSRPLHFTSSALKSIFRSS